jgi:transcriptional regulator with GAF, ATPase, and Fis domain
MGRRLEPLSHVQLERLRGYAWPGNVRELQNVVERGVITARQGQLNLDYALPHAADHDDAAVKSAELPAHTVLTVKQLHQFERQNLLLALERCHWRVSGKDGAAQLVGLPPSTLQSRMKAFGIKRPH